MRAPGRHLADHIGQLRRCHGGQKFRAGPLPYPVIGFPGTKGVLAEREWSWFTADEAHGDNPGLRDWLDEQDINYVMAVSCDAHFMTPTGPQRADELAASAPKRGWQRPSCGAGSKGDRLYDRLLVDAGADRHLLLVRHSISKPSELAHYICRASTPVPVAELVRVAGCRWGVEETFQFAKNETGLDHYQVRKYDAWYRHITLSMLAAAFLAITAYRERSPDEKGARILLAST